MLAVADDEISVYCKYKSVLFNNTGLETTDVVIVTITIPAAAATAAATNSK